MPAFSCCRCCSCLSSFLFFFPDRVMFALGLDLKEKWWDLTGNNNNMKWIHFWVCSPLKITSSFTQHIKYWVSVDHWLPLLQVMDGDETLVDHGSDNLPFLPLVSAENSPPLEKLLPQLLQDDMRWDGEQHDWNVSQTRDGVFNREIFLLRTWRNRKWNIILQSDHQTSRRQKKSQLRVHISAPFHLIIKAPFSLRIQC